MSANFSWLIASLMFLALAAGGGRVPASAAHGMLVVANQREHTALLIDPETRQEVAKVVVGVNGHEVAVSPDSRFAYVPIYGNSGVGKPGTDGTTIDIVDLRDHKLAATIDLGKPLRPHRAEFGPDGLLYVTAELDKAVDVIDPATRKVIAEIPTGAIESHMVVISPDGSRAYTANVAAGSVSVLDLKKRALVTVIPVAKIVQRISISARWQARLHSRSRHSAHRGHRHNDKQGRQLDFSALNCLFLITYRGWTQIAGGFSRRKNLRHRPGQCKA